jgi:hypothetical protein
MKAVYLYIYFLLFFALKGLSQTILNTENDLNEKYRKYIGKEVYNFLLDDNIRIYKLLYFSTEPPGVLSHVTLRLVDSLYVRIYINDLKYQKRYNEQLNWNEKLIHKEKISRIVFTVHNLDEKIIANIR